MKINDIPVQDDTHIRIILQRLFAGSETLVILDRDESHFLQTDGKELMFKNPEGLYRTPPQEFTLEELQELFIKYYHHHTGCLQNYQWEVIPGFSDWETEPEENEEANNKRLADRLKKLFRK